MFSSGLFQFSKFLDMPEKCEYCGLKFMPEPGFYMGSMFVSYALFSWGMLILVAVFYLLFHFGIDMSIFLAVMCGLLSFTYVIRLSRAIALHVVKRCYQKIGLFFSDKVFLLIDTKSDWPDSICSSPIINGFKIQ